MNPENNQAIFRGIIATSAPVKTTGEEAKYHTECLFINKNTPLPDKIPLLDTHARGSAVGNVLGHARNLRVETIEGFAGEPLFAIVGDIVFSDISAGVVARNLVEAGHVWGLSAGCTALNREKIGDGETVRFQGEKFEGSMILVEAFELLEVSLCVIPKDRHCRIETYFKKEL